MDPENPHYSRITQQVQHQIFINSSPMENAVLGGRAYFGTGRPGTSKVERHETLEGFLQEQTKENLKVKHEKKEITCDMSKSDATRLENILDMHKKSTRYCDARRDHEAFGLLDKQYHAGPDINFLSTLINFYETLLKTDRGDEAGELFDRIYDILTTKLKVSTEECQKLAKKYFKENKFFKSILFYLLGGRMLIGVKEHTKVLNGIQTCMLGIKLCVMKISENSPSFCKVIKEYILAKVSDLHDAVFPQVIGKSKKELVRVEALCLHHLEVCQRFVGNPELEEATLKRSIAKLESVLGEGAKKTYLYGAALSNLGSCYLLKKRLEEAAVMLIKAIEINKSAEDYDTEEEREQDKQRSTRALDMVMEMQSAMHSAQD